MIRHLLIATMAVLSIGLTSEALARSGAGGAGHGGMSAGVVGARSAGARAPGMLQGSALVGRNGYRAVASFAGYRSSSSYGYRSLSAFGHRQYTGSYAGSGAYGVAPNGGTPVYSAAGVFVPGNPTQTPVAPPAIYQIERSGAVSRMGRTVSNDRRPGIYPVGISDGVQPSIYVVRVPRG